MTLFFSLLPLYLFGNIHCLGMCGPLVMLIGQHRYRLWYFIGRLTSFALAGLLAGTAGTVVHLILKDYYISELLSLTCGLLMIVWGVHCLFGYQNVHRLTIMKWTPLNNIHQWISTLLLKDTGTSTFLFGFFTVALPCGQTLVVFSACAIAGNAWTGLGNGFALALLTTPSLFFAMHTLTWLSRFKRHERTVLGGSAMLVGLLACSRSLAAIGWIEHWTINWEAAPNYHLVIF